MGELGVEFPVLLFLLVSSLVSFFLAEEEGESGGVEVFLGLGGIIVMSL